MTLDQSLANLQAQADRLAGHFAAISDRIEADGGAAGIRIAEARTEHLTAPPGFGEGARLVREAFDHVHFAQGGAPEPIQVRQDTPVGVVAATDGSLLNFEGENYVPQPAPHIPTDAELREREEGTATPPWVAQASEPAPAPAAEAPKKKGGRRTLEEIAADNGVELSEVRAWYGEGKKVTKTVIEEYAELKKAGAAAAATNPIALPAQAADPFGNPGTPMPAPAPVQNTAPAPEPVTGMQPPAAPQYIAPAPAPAAPTPGAGQYAAQPVPTPDFGAGTEAITDWDPFKS